MKRNIINTAILLFLILSIRAVAQDVKFTATAPSTVSVGQSFRVTYTVNAKGTNFKAPAFKDFNIVSGPNQSTSSSIQIINGNMTQSVEYSFSYILQALSEGTFTYPGATINVEGKTYTSNSITIHVVKGSTPPPQANNNRYQQQQQDYGQTPQIGGQDIFVRTIPSKTTVYQGEPLVVVQKIYTKLNLVGFESSKFPDYNGFWTEEIKMPDQITLVNENYNGTIYRVAELKKTILFPQKSGKITIDPTELECIVRVNRRSNNFWDNFFGGMAQDIKQKVKNQPIVITVNPLPEQGKPDDFSGMVGNFKMDATISQTKVKANEAIDLKIVISGSGNLRLVEKLNFNFPPDIEVYDPKITDNISTTQGGVSGSRTFEYLLIPRNAGTFKIAPVTFSFFDINKKQYQTLSTPEWTLEVLKGDGSSSNVVTSVKREDLKYIGSDIHFIKSGNLNLRLQGDVFFLSPLFIVLLLAAPVLFAFFFVLMRKRIKANQNIAAMRNKKATKVARKRLKKAAELMKAGDNSGFYEEVSRALFGYTSDKLNMQFSELSIDNLKAGLEKAGIPDNLIATYIAVVEDCEFARFAPSAAQNLSPENIYQRSVEAITQIENTYKI